MYHIKEVAELSGVSVRTLHHYDAIGLLVPDKSENNYRVYSEEDLDRLQQILFYKVLGFPLKEIGKLLQAEEGRRLESLLKQRNLLEDKRDELSRLLVTIDKTIKDYKGVEKMTVQEKFDGFSKEYFGMNEAEAKEKYGDKAVENAKLNIYDNPQVAEKWVGVFMTVASFKAQGLPVTDSKVQEQVGLLYQYMNQYAFDCSLAVFGQIGQTYVADERFKANIDRAGEGTAAYISEAIALFVKQA